MVLLEHYKMILDRYASLSVNSKQNLLNESDFTGEALYYVETFNKTTRYLAELQEFAANLSNGRLKIDPPPRDNYLAAPIKNLHSQLRHLTWQAKQVAEGDYSQTIDFMGEFADAFNTMITKLAERERRFELDHAIFLNVFEKNPNAVIVFDAQKEILFSNKSAKEIFLDSRGNTKQEKNKQEFINMLFALPMEKENLEIQFQDDQLYYSVQKNEMEWVDGRTAYLHILYDITKMKLSEIELMSMAYIDKASGIGNKNSAQINIQKLVNDKVMFALTFIDMDKLKYINDNYGHNEGDYALRTLAQFLKSSIREKELVFRLGGDEFVLILLGCDETTADMIMQRIRNNAVSLAQEKPFDINFSYGVYIHTADKTETVSEILTVADEKMYIDKRQRKAQRVS